MIYGIGTDVCDIRRMAATLARRGDRFAEKVLGPHELEVFRARRARVESRGISYLATRFAAKVLGPHEIEVFRERHAKVEARGVSYLATRFSAKEAFAKAIGLGMRMPMTWRDCEVVKAPSGKPGIRLHGELAAWCTARGLAAHVSVSDESEYAASFVVVEKKS